MVFVLRAAAWRDDNDRSERQRECGGGVSIQERKD
jgi:hypothetical protein